MCVLLSLLLAGPRFAIFIWWLIAPGRWDNAFSTVIWPLLGFVFLPWTTLMFVAVAPLGHVSGADWLFLALAFVLDWMSYSGGVYGRRSVPYYTGP